MNKETGQAAKTTPANGCLDPGVDAGAVVANERILANVPNPSPREEYCRARVAEGRGIDLLRDANERCSD